MKQLTLFGFDDKKYEIDKEYENEPILIKKKFAHLLLNHYVRTKDNNTYYINTLSKSQKVYCGFETKRKRNGEKYNQDIYEMRERCVFDIKKDGKYWREIIRSEDVVLQSPFLIDLCFKDDCILTKDGNFLFVEHKVLKKVIEIEKYENIGGVSKKKVKKSRSFLLCDKGRKVLYEEDLKSLIYNPKFDYKSYLEVGMRIKCDFWGWCDVLEILGNTIICKNNMSRNHFSLKFWDIIDCRE